MIYLKNTTDPQTVRLPANGAKGDGLLLLELVNTIDLGPVVTLECEARLLLADAEDALVHDSQDRQILLAGKTGSHLYLVFEVELPAGMPEGEYEYTARMEGAVISTGLLIIGERRADTDEYENSIEYEQYND